MCGRKGLVMTNKIHSLYLNHSKAFSGTEDKLNIITKDVPTALI